MKPKVLPHLQTLAQDIYEIKIKNFIILQVKWIPWKLKNIADTLNKTYDVVNWETSHISFHYLSRLWRPFTIDRFANGKTRKLKNSILNFDIWCIFHRMGKHQQLLSTPNLVNTEIHKTNLVIKKAYCVKSIQIQRFYCSLFSCIQTEYWGLLCKSPYSVRIQENTDQKIFRLWTLFTHCQGALVVSLWC